MAVKVLIVEDVVTRGTSTREVADIVVAGGGVVTAVASLIARTDDSVALPAPMTSLAKVEVVTWAPEECPLCAEGVEVDQFRMDGTWFHPFSKKWGLQSTFSVIEGFSISSAPIQNTAIPSSPACHHRAIAAILFTLRYLSGALKDWIYYLIS